MIATNKGKNKFSNKNSVISMIITSFLGDANIILLKNEF